jgi:hypothetical protein
VRTGENLQYLFAGSSFGSLKQSSVHYVQQVQSVQINLHHSSIVMRTAENSNVNNVTWVCPFVTGGLLLRTDIIPFCTIPNVVLRINITLRLM